MILVVMAVFLGTTAYPLWAKGAPPLKDQEVKQAPYAIEREAQNEAEVEKQNALKEPNESQESYEYRYAYGAVYKSEDLIVNREISLGRYYFNQISILTFETRLVDGRYYGSAEYTPPTASSFLDLESGTIYTDERTYTKGTPEWQKAWKTMLQQTNELIWANIRAWVKAMRSGNSYAAQYLKRQHQDLLKIRKLLLEAGR